MSDAFARLASMLNTTSSNYRLGTNIDISNISSSNNNNSSSGSGMTSSTSMPFMSAAQQQQFQFQMQHQQQQQLQQQQNQQQTSLLNSTLDSSAYDSDTNNESKSLVNLLNSSHLDNTSSSARPTTEHGTYMPGTASLIQDVDKQLMVILRDGRTLIGYLRSIDQYANLLLSSTIERIHVGNKYGDIARGVYIIRGENVVLIGELDSASTATSGGERAQQQQRVEMIKVDYAEIVELQRVEQQKQLNIEKNKKRQLLTGSGGLLPQSDSILDDYY